MTVALLSLALAVLDPNTLPDPLRPWVGWVTHDKPEWACPHQDDKDQGDGAVCTFVATVSLDCKNQGCGFEQIAWSHHEDNIELVGDAHTPPLDVVVDGQRGIVANQDGRYVVRVTAGAHKIVGKLQWKETPESLQLPRAAALVRLALNGKPRRLLSRDDDGRLWLQREGPVHEDDDEAEVSAEPEVEVFRRLVDDQPALLISRIRMTLSGKSRQLTLTSVLPDGWRPVSLESKDLPARLLQNGTLSVETRAGRHEVVITAVATKTISEVRIASGLAEDSEEVWVFEPRPRLRLVSVEGVTAVDPKQTTLPDDWKQLSTFRLTSRDVMQLVEKQRGQSDDDRDRLRLQRSVWLDFSGHGYSSRDHLTGTLSGIRRLETLPGLQLGRVADHGDNQLITGGNESAGVELRSRDVQLELDGRLIGPIHTLPAVGYDADMDSVTLNLQLPPGWRLFAAGGVDSAHTWLTAWTLLDWFGVALLVLATRKLFGTRAAVVAGLVLVLTFTEAKAPRFVWIALIAAEALHRFVRHERALRWVRVCRVAAVLVFAFVAVPFLALDIRVALHPQLEANLHEDDWNFPVLAAPGAKMAMQSAPEAEAVADEEEQDLPAQVADIAGGAGSADRAKSSLGYGKNGGAKGAKKKDKVAQRRGARQLLSAAEQAAVQTGPGMVDWTFKGTVLGFSGPVPRDHQVRLWLLSPWQMSLVRWLRVALLVLTFLLFFGSSLPSGVLPRAFGAVLPLLWLGWPTSAHAHDTNVIPPAEVLEELKTRLLAPATCRPHCASLGHLSLSVVGDVLTATVDISAHAPTVVPIPGHASQWLPDLVEIDGKPATQLWLDDEGQLHIAIHKGAAKLRISGNISGRDTVSLAMPLPPLSVSLLAPQYKLEGLDEDARPTESLQLVRTNKVEARDEPGKADIVSALAQFFAIERHFQFGLQWEVDTIVMRRSPPTDPATFELALLPNETLTTSGLRAEAGKVAIGFAPGQERVSFKSVLSPANPLVLQAPSASLQSWTWTATVESIWHLQSEGLPNTAQPVRGDLEWHPRPGEQVVLKLSRPTAMAGQTLTIEKSEYHVVPGLRESNATLRLQMISSRGGDHFVTLPAGAELESVDVDGQRTTVRREGQRVALPIHPGQMVAELRWREPRGASTRFVATSVALGVPSVNARMQVDVPQGRWLWWTSGPRTGPAILFWSMLVLIVIVGAVLGRVPHAPLSSAQFVLLGMGLAQVGVEGAAVVVGFMLALQWRERFFPTWKSRWRFNLAQLLFIAWALGAASVLFEALRTGLVSVPDMDVTGWGSSGRTLYWYQDRVADTLPEVAVWSVPLWIYRIVMLAWALWLASFLAKYARRAAVSFSAGAFWRTEKP